MNMTTNINTNEKYVLALDLDNTLADYTGGLRRHMMQKLHLPAESFPPPTNYDMAQAGWPFKDRKEFLESHAEAVRFGLFRNLEPQPGAVEAVRALVKEGIHISVVTHRLLHDDTYAMVVSDTVQWLDTVGIRYHSLSFSGRKSEIRAHAYVDDAPFNVEAIRQAGMRAYTFDQPYNKDLWGPRIHTWEGEGVEKILAHKKALGF